MRLLVLLVRRRGLLWKVQSYDNRRLSRLELPLMHRLFMAGLARFSSRRIRKDDVASPNITAN